MLLLPTLVCLACGSAVSCKKFGVATLADMVRVY